jgi:threonine/homoserine/homoserine lactone efflux protein
LITILRQELELASVLEFGAIAWFSSALRAGLLCSDAVQTMLNRIAALVFIGLAMRLILVEL